MKKKSTSVIITLIPAMVGALTLTAGCSGQDESSIGKNQRDTTRAVGARGGTNWWIFNRGAYSTPTSGSSGILPGTKAAPGKATVTRGGIGTTGMGMSAGA